MKQKLALACTLVHEPPLLVLDEPTTGVDPVSRREFWKLLAEFLAQGLTIVLATPYLDEAERCGRVALLQRGTPCWRSTSRRSCRQSLPGAVLEVVVAPPRRALEALGGTFGADRVQLFGDRLHVRVGRRADAATRLATALDAPGLAPASVVRDRAESRGRVHRLRWRGARPDAAAHHER